MSLAQTSFDNDGVAVITLNRPERRNALSGELIEDLHRALDDAESRQDIRVAVLTGAGRAFCAGGDLAGGMVTSGGVVAGHQARGRFGELLQRISESRLPVVCAANGDALGGGLGLAVACDMVVADPQARFGTPEIKLGLFPWVILAVLQRNIPRKRLMEMVLTGERMSAEMAESVGFINQVSAPGQCVPEAMALAHSIACRAPLALSLGKSAFHAVADQRFDDALRYLNTQLTLNLMTSDAMEGVSAFMQKREPTWKGR